MHDVETCTNSTHLWMICFHFSILMSTFKQQMTGLWMMKTTVGCKVLCVELIEFITSQHGYNSYISCQWSGTGFPTAWKIMENEKCIFQTWKNHGIWKKRPKSWHFKISIWKNHGDKFWRSAHSIQYYHIVQAIITVITFIMSVVCGYK